MLSLPHFPGTTYVSRELINLTYFIHLFAWREGDYENTNPFAILYSCLTTVFGLRRINHSCRPNCVWSWNGTRGVLEVRSIRLILKGEEIARTYYPDITHLSATRNSYLVTQYEFRCGCESCTTKPSDDIRAKIADLHRRAHSLERPADHKDDKGKIATGMFFRHSAHHILGGSF